jgi:hypothetical protein
MFISPVIGCLAGYVAFWTYFARRPAGEAYSIASIVAGAACLVLLVLLLRPANRRSLAALDVAVPLVLLYLVSLCYVSVTFACSITTPVTYLNQFCHLSTFTGDDIPSADDPVIGLAYHQLDLQGPMERLRRQRS